jgi:hypothetical protein
MNDFVAGELRIDIFEGAPPAPSRLFWSGRAIERDPERLLMPFYERVLGAAVERKCAIEMHFERLEHFNSSTVGTVIRLIQDARKRGVKLVLVFRETLRWQKVSFEALAVFVKDDGLLELRGRS